MAEIARIVATAVRDPFAVIRDLGGDPVLVCAAAGLDAAIFASAGAMLPLSAFVRLIQQGSAELRIPHFGRLVGQRFDVTNLGEVGEAALRAPTLGAALRLIERTFAAVQGESDLRLTVSGEVATLSYRILDGRIWPRDQDAELTLGVFISLIAGVAGPGWRPVALSFEHPANGADRQAAPGPVCAVTYDAPANAMTFHARVLDLPMPRSDPGTFPLVAGALRELAHRMDLQADVEARVRRAVFRGLGRERIDQSSVARSLGMSRRTLRRRLDEAGTGFAEIVADCRDADARRLLEKTSLPVGVIAERLGYSDATAFVRAFARRCGLTPAGYRRSVSGGEA